MGRRNRLLVGACLVVGCGTILRASGASALTATDGPAAHHQTGNLQKGCCANSERIKILSWSDDLDHPKRTTNLVRARNIRRKGIEL
jgi:hypothetical protein